ncbi:MAG: GGDEF domain-containing protein [Lachnospiraceae bacterium]|nr:GGDEF domain-containing protein [Lachnospiraceae bacterium]
MGIFNKWNKAGFMDRCAEPFTIVRFLESDGKPTDLEIVYANQALASLAHMERSDLTAKRFSGAEEEAVKEWVNLLTPAASGESTVNCRRFLEPLKIVTEITAFPIEPGVVGLMLQDYTGVVQKLVKGIAGKEVGIFYYDMTNDLVIADSSMLQFFGGKEKYEGMLASFAKEWIDESFVDLLRSQLSEFPYPSGLIEINLKLKNGNFVRLSLTADVRSEEETLAIGYMADISNAPTLAEQEERDTLTGLFHAVSAKDRIDKAIMDCYDSGRIDAMILLDLDHFDSVNETLGYEAGDEMLKKVAEILKNNFKGKDIIARPGGDSFIVYVSDLNDKRSALQICRTLNKLVTQTIPRGEDEPLRITASIGVAFACDNGGNYEKLYQNATTAMEETKANGRNGYTLA